MTEWNASGYFAQSGLQKSLADACLAGLRLEGGERVLDIGCGDGKITAGIAERLPHGSILGIDPSTQMIDFARAHFEPTHTNLAFEVGDATILAYREAFDLIVSFNALHWVRDQPAALAGMHAALARGGRAVLQFVPRGERTSLEDVLEQVCTSPRWAGSFRDHQRPYLHVAPDEYRGLAEAAGLRVESLEIHPEAWDFGSRSGFVDFARETFVEWTRRIRAGERDEFIADVLDRYRKLGDGSAADAAVFHFYQMRVVLRRPQGPAPMPAS